MINRLAIVILAAGDGKRLLSSTPKPFHLIAGLPLLAHVLASTKKLQPVTTAVVLQEKTVDTFWELFSSLPPDPSVITAIQPSPLGTGHAVMCAWDALQNLHNLAPFSHILTLPADTPLISHHTLDSLIDFHHHQKHTISVTGFTPHSPKGYGRLISKQQKLSAIREEKDCSPQEKNITFCNGGIMLINTPFFQKAISQLSPQNQQNELYLTDLVAIATQQNLTCGAFPATNNHELLGINNREDLALVEQKWQEQQRLHFMNNVGVSFSKPDSVILHHDTIIKKNASISPFVVFGKQVVVEENALVMPFSHLEGVTIKPHASIGPFSRIRPHSTIEAHAKIGSFVEVKNSSLGTHSKASHLAYIGDAKIEAHVNIGAGTVIANYDGHHKYTTTIKEGAFIGSNTTLVAPLTIGEQAFATAGSVIVYDIPPKQRAFARAPQVLKPKKNQKK